MSTESPIIGFGLVRSFMVRVVFLAISLCGLFVRVRSAP